MMGSGIELQFIKAREGPRAIEEGWMVPYASCNPGEEDNFKNKKAKTENKRTRMQAQEAAMCAGEIHGCACTILTGVWTINLQRAEVRGRAHGTEGSHLLLTIWIF